MSVMSDVVRSCRIVLDAATLTQKSSNMRRQVIVSMGWIVFRVRVRVRARFRV